MVATSSAESRNDGSSLFHPDRQIAAFDELRHDEAESVFRATHIEDRHDVGMVQLGEDPGFNRETLPASSGRVIRSGLGHLDGDRAVEVVVVSEIDPSEPALTEPTDDPIAPDLGGIDVGEVARTLNGRLRAGGSRQAPGLIRGAIRTPSGRSATLPFQTRSSSHPLFDP